MTHERQHRVVVTLTAMVFAFGIYFAIVAVVDQNPAKKVTCTVASALNFAGGIWVLVRRRKSDEHNDPHG